MFCFGNLLSEDILREKILANSCNPPARKIFCQKIFGHRKGPLVGVNRTILFGLHKKAPL